MKNLIQAAVVTLFAASAAQAQQAMQWKVSDGGNGHWYQRVGQDGSGPSICWRNASDRCRAVGGDLVSINNQHEEAFLLSLCPNFAGWIGYQGTGYWSSGEPVTFTHWGPGQPSGDGPYATAYCSNGWWNDIGGSNGCWSGLSSYTIEWSADCNSDGIVDYGQCQNGTLPDYNGDNIPDCCERGEACVGGNYPVQWRLEDGGNGHWYELRTMTSTSWLVHRDATIAIGGHLATITSPAEDSFVQGLIPRTVQWLFGPTIGLFQLPGAAEPDRGWQWVTSEPFQYSGWFPGEPNDGPGYGEHWVRFRFTNGTLAWNDVPESLPAEEPLVSMAIVEWSADCNNDGIVDYGQILTGQLSDTNTDGIPDACQCATDPSLPACCLGDLDHDATVGGADIGLLLSNWGPCGSACPYDLNEDNKVNGGDLGLMLAFWGPCPH